MRWGIAFLYFLLMVEDVQTPKTPKGQCLDTEWSVRFSEGLGFESSSFCELGSPPTFLLMKAGWLLAFHF